ncbi:hypothetical protein GQX74_012523 [Glossina fuscipes]|nr:hypothetical protein GQX74_012523 [Glossina fuscipes]
MSHNITSMNKVQITAKKMVSCYLGRKYISQSPFFEYSTEREPYSYNSSMAAFAHLIIFLVSKTIQMSWTTREPHHHQLIGLVNLLNRSYREGQELTDGSLREAIDLAYLFPDSFRRGTHQTVCRQPLQTECCGDPTSLPSLFFTLIVSMFLLETVIVLVNDNIINNITAAIRVSIHHDMLCSEIAAATAAAAASAAAAVAARFYDDDIDDTV